MKYTLPFTILKQFIATTVIFVRWFLLLSTGLFITKIQAQENCSNAQYLGAVSGTYSGTTVGAANDISTCRTGYPDKVFYFTVANGYTIDIWEPSNGYDEYEYLGYGASCPGTQIQCWDNDGLAHIIWTNTTGSSQNVWWIQDAYSGSGTFNLQWTITAPPAGDNCGNAQNLASLSSPYSGTTVGYANDISTCRTGYPDRVFYLDVPNCNTIDIWESTNGYDEWEYVGYGASCPGTTTINCWDNDALAHTVWNNSTGSTQRVWYIQDGYNGSGTFTLNWSLSCPLPSQPSTISGTTNPEPGTSQVYSVTNVSGVSYTWAFPSGWNITSGQGTYSVTVTAGTVNGNITVTPSNCCGTGTARTLATNIPAYRWKYVSSNTGLSNWCTGESRNISITIKNTGTATWNSSYTTNVGLKWNTNGSNWTDYHVRVTAGNLASGQQQTYNFTIQAKDATAGPVYGGNLAAGSNNLTFDLVNEGNCWFANNGGSCGPGNVVFTSAAQTIQSLSVAPTGISGTTSICAGQSTTLSVSGGTAGTGAVAQWFTGSCGGTLIGTGNSISVSPGSSTTYYVRYSGNCNTTGCAFATVNVATAPGAGSNVWNVLCYSDNNFTNYAGYYTENRMGFDTYYRWGPGSSPSSANALTGNAYSGCSIGGDNHSYIYLRTGFPTGTYSISVNRDDDSELKINGTSVYNTAGWNFYTNVWTGTLNSSSTVEYRVREYGGNSYGGLVFNYLTVPYSGSNSVLCGTNFTLMDHQGISSNSSTDYTNYADGYTVLNNTPTSSTTVTISGSFYVESCCDRIYIYDGSGTGGTLLASYGSSGSGTFSYTSNPGQTLTVRFYSDLSVTSYGFIADVVYSGDCAPGNNNCANAINVSSLPYTSAVIDNYFATDDYTTSTCDGPYKNVWWKVTGICGTMTAITCTGNTNFDNEIAVFTGSCGSFSQVTCNDDNGAGCTNNYAGVSWNSTAGTLYYISVGSYYSGGTTGNLQLQVSGSDVTAPTLSNPGNQSLNTPSNSCTATYVIADPISDNCSATWGYSTTGATVLSSGGNTIADGNSSGTLTFNKGTTTVTLTGTDGINAASSVSFSIVVTDNLLPTISSCPSNISVNTAAGVCNATAGWTTPAWTDNCMTPPAIAGMTYLGTYGGNFYYQSNGNFTWPNAKADAISKGGRLVVIESSGENTFVTNAISTNCWIGFTDEVTEGNFVSVTGVPLWYSNWYSGEPNNAGNEDYAEIYKCCGANGYWNDNTGSVSEPYILEFGLFQTAGLANGATYPLGTTTNTYHAYDFAGNASSTCSFTVTVVDNQLPVISNCPANINICGTTVSWTAPTASDNCSISNFFYETTPTAGLTNGGTFPSGTTTVTYTARDASNNQTQCSFTVSVTANAPASVSISSNPAAISGVTTSCSGTSVTFTASPTNGGSNPSYAWKVNGSPAPGGTNSNTYTSTSLANGNLVTVEMTSNATCATGNPATSNTITMVVNPTPAALVLTGSSICASPGNNGTITSSTSAIGVSYQLYNSGNATVQSPKSGTGSGLTWSSLAAGNGYYVIATLGSCTANSSPVNVSTTANPAAPTIGTITQPNCSGVNTGSVILNGLPSGNWTVTGNPSGGTTGNTTSATVNSLTPNTTFTFTVMDAAGCVSASSNGVVINATPGVPATPAASVAVQPTCAVNSGTIVVSSPTGAAYEYSLDGGTYQASTTFTGVASGNHTITVRLIISPDCVSNPSGTLTVNSNPTPLSTTPVYICQGGSGSLTATSVCVDNFQPVTIPGPNQLYGGWLATDATANSPGSALNTTTCSFTGSARTYSTIQFQVSATGNYIFEMNNNTVYNGAGYIVTGSFTPGSCGSGTLVRADSDEGAGDEPILGGSGGAGAMTLTAGVTYTLVSTTQGASNVINNDYTWTITAPAGENVLINQPGTVEWYNTSSGGSPIGYGTSFNPVGVAGSGLSNTNTVGTTSFYAACSSSPSCRTQSDFVIQTGAPLFNVTPVNGVSCSNPSSPVAIGLSGSTNGYPYQLLRDGITIGSPVTGNGTLLSFGSFSTEGTYTVNVNNGTCSNIAMTGSVLIKPSPIADAGTDVTACNGTTPTLNATSNSTNLFSENFGTNVSTQLSSTATNGWKIKYLYGTEPSNRTEWWISYNGANPYGNMSNAVNCLPAGGGSSGIILLDHRIYQTQVPCDYAWDAGTMDEVAYNTTPVDARFYTSVNVSFDYMVGGTFSGSNVYDYLQVVYSLDNGATWSAVNAGNNGGSYTLYRQLSGTTNAFFSVTANTPVTGTANIVMPAAVIGQKFLLGFRWVNDGTLTGAYVGGPMIDNISITGAASYAWSPTSGLSNSNIPNPTVTGGGTYTVVVTAGNGCTASDDINVNLSSSINITAEVDQCSRHLNSPSTDQYYVYVNASGGTPNFSFSGTPLMNSGTNASPIRIYAQNVNTSTIYTVTDNFGCFNTATVQTPLSNPIDVSSANTYTSTCYNISESGWMEFTKPGATANAPHEVILSLRKQNANDDLGLVTVKVWVESSEPQIQQGQSNNCWGYNYTAHKRHYAIIPEHQPTGLVDIRFYDTDIELNSLFSASLANDIVNDQCSYNDNITSINDMYLTDVHCDIAHQGLEDGDYNNNNPAYCTYKVFGNNNVVYGNTNGSLTKSLNGFNSLPAFTNGLADRNYYQVNGLTELSEFWLHGSRHAAPLPVTMIYLRADAIDNAYIKLTWATALEINNDGFAVERSEDGTNWTNIGWVEGHDNTTVQQNYSFNDNNVIPQVVYYYRLKQIDNDGQFEYTYVVSALLNGEITIEVKDFVPNPASGFTRLNILAAENKTIVVEFYDMLGRKVKTSEHPLMKGVNKIDFNTSDFAAGTYSGVVKTNNEFFSKKLVITK